MHRPLLTLLLLVNVVACGTPPTPTAPPATADQSIAATLDEAVRLTATALAVNAATPTLPPLPPENTPAPVTIPVTNLPLPTFTSPPANEPSPTPEASQPEVIQIAWPATGSAVASPVIISGVADGTFEQTLVIRITDETGNTLTTVPTTIVAEQGQRGPYEAEVQFSVPNDQPGRISVFSTSARDGGLIHLTSVEVTLLAAGGAANIVPAEAKPERHIIQSPTLLATASGGVLHLSGFSEYVFESNLGVMLCGEGGSGDPDLICGTLDNLLLATNVLIQSPDVGLPGPFETDLVYSVALPTRARLVVFSASARDGGLMHLASQEIVLEP